ncbi:MAG: hypothetical protein KDD06_27595, partial [Phaeodactylibacter sp.]|nr:hypothetical protein [Phaeodactylibacter sp.]
LPPDCQGGAGSVEVTFADDQQLYTFDWRKGGVTVSTSSSLSGDIGGRYSLTATGQQGMAASALFSVVPQGLPYISNWEIHNASCGVANDGNISVSIPGGAGDNSLSWNNGATGPQVFGLAPGQYILEVSNPGGCSYEEFYTVGQ